MFEVQGVAVPLDGNASTGSCTHAVQGHKAQAGQYRGLVSRRAVIFPQDHIAYVMILVLHRPVATDGRLAGGGAHDRRLTHHAVSLERSHPPVRLRRSTVRETLTTCFTSGCQSSSSQFAGTPQLRTVRVSMRPWPLSCCRRERNSRQAPHMRQARLAGCPWPAPARRLRFPARAQRFS